MREKRKKILAAGVGGCLLLVFGIGMTVFWSLGQRTFVSVSSMEEPVLIRTCFLSSGEDYTEDRLTGLLPGETVECEPAVVLDKDSPEAYIRVRLTFGGILGEQPSENRREQKERLERIRELQEGIRFCAGWLEGQDGCMYYQEKVSPGRTVPVYEQVLVPKNWDNKIAEKVFTIELTAEAVRSEHLEPWLLQNSEIRSWQ